MQLDNFKHLDDAALVQHAKDVKNEFIDDSSGNASIEGGDQVDELNETAMQMIQIAYELGVRGIELPNYFQ